MKHIKSVAVYCGSSINADQVYQQAASDLGKVLANAGIQLVYGGSHLGLMGLVADGALKNGGKAIGFTTKMLAKVEGSHDGLNQLQVVDTMHIRKMSMSENADAFVILPGGFGTLDELFEVLTWRQLKMHDKPIIIANINGYWDPLRALMEEVIACKFAKPEDKKLVEFVSSIEDILPLLRQFPEPKVGFDTKFI